jgi:hypothetical protein
MHSLQFNQKFRILILAFIDGVVNDLNDHWVLKPNILTAIMAVSPLYHASLQPYLGLSIWVGTQDYRLVYFSETLK